MSSTIYAWERANLLLPEILSHRDYKAIRLFYHQVTGDANARTLSHMLADRLTFGFVIGQTSLIYPEITLELISLLAKGAQEQRVRSLKPESTASAGLKVEFRI